MNILITGVAGYLGIPIASHLLQKKHKVIGVDNLMYNQQYALLNIITNPNFQFHKLDVRDTFALVPLLRKVDVIIHLAALVGAPICNRLPKETVEINEQATVNLVKFVDHNQLLLYPNSNSGYGTTNKSTYWCDETEPIKPISTYATTKCNAETAVLNRHNAVSVRLSTVCGVAPRMRFDLLVNDITSRLVYHPKLEIYQPEFKRNFVHIKDVVNCFDFLMRKFGTHSHHFIGSQVFNLGHPNGNLTKLELVNLIAAKIGLTQDAITIVDGEDKDKRNYFINSNKIINEGFTFQHPIDTAIEEIIGFCKITPENEIAKMRNA